MHAFYVCCVYSETNSAIVETSAILPKFILRHYILVTNYNPDAVVRIADGSFAPMHTMLYCTRQLNVSTSFI